MKRRVPRKTKKWAKQYGWTVHFDAEGCFYFSRTIGHFKLKRNIYG
jgi:hypothetical protein